MDKTINALKKLKGVKAIILFGSYARGRQRNDSDIDLCVISEGNEALEHTSEKIRICVFSQLPLEKRLDAFRHGKMVWCIDETLLRRIKICTMRECQDGEYWRNKTAELIASGY